MSTPRITISPQMHVALDAARAIASFYIPLHHLAQAWSLSGPVGYLFRFGQEAVIAFFLLSGFLIFANEQHRLSTDLRGYALRRLIRVYPPMIASLVVAMAIAWGQHRLGDSFSWSELFGTLFALQDVSALKPGVIVDSFMGNTPLWSLSYEIGFYTLFPLVLWAYHRNPAICSHAVGLICAATYGVYMLYPGHFVLVVAYFQLWWLGAMIAAAYGRGQRNILAVAPVLAWMVVLCLMALVDTLRAGGSASIGVYPALMLRHFVVGTLAAVVLFSSLGRILTTILSKGRLVVGPLAAVSYGVYVMHYPVMIHTSSYASFETLLAAILTTLALAWLVDKGGLQTYLGKVQARRKAVVASG